MFCARRSAFAPWLALAFLGGLFPTSAGAAPAVVMAPEVVTASRAPQPAADVAATLKVFDDAALRHAPALTLDGALRSVPAFSLFRRSDSLIANPTAQGVSLRGLGPSGASRSLVLLDGVPLNDPFGGWVAWTKLPRESLSTVEVVPGGGATAWGNAALGGVVQLRSSPGTRLGRASLLVGDYGTRSAELVAAHDFGPGNLSVAARMFSTDGFSLVAPERRGPIDIGAWSRHRWVSARWSQRVNEIDLAVSARGFEETRGNGTPYQQNRSREKALTFTAAARPTRDFAWEAVGYAQDQSFASTFSAVNATRSAETPASDQFDVPAEAFGAAWTGVLRHADGARSNFGLDGRFVSGETRENYTFANGNFTRQRVAGGEQQVAGLFALHERALTPALRATVGARLDSWRDSDGHRREHDRVSGAIFRDDTYAERDGRSFSPSVGAVWQVRPNWRLRANAQHAFRRPTLNELYRPFRVGPNVTEANAALGTERVTSAEVGAQWSLFDTAPPTNSSDLRTLLTLGAVAFWNDLRDAVGNVTIARGPGTFPIVGFVAAGGLGRQRLNLDRSRVRGFELSARWTPTSQTAVTAEYLYNDARVTSAPIAPGLVGKRIAQVPRHSASFGASLALPAQFAVHPRVRFIGRQFEDDENQLILGAVVIADLSVSRPLNKHLELFFTLENLGDVRIETGRNADGLVNVGTPRLLVGGLRGSW